MLQFMPPTRTLRYFTIGLAVVPFHLAAQTITLTFEGTVNGAPTALDSILVRNLTQGGDTTIYLPDNILVLGGVGVGAPWGMGDGMLRALSNPFAGSTEVVVDATGGDLLVLLHDALGRELVHHSVTGAAGACRFLLSCGEPGVHLLTVVQDGARRTLRLVCTEAHGGAGLTTSVRTERGITKRGRSLFSWTAGDELRYIGYATSGTIVHSAAIQEAPSTSATRTFIMTAGRVCPDSPTVTDVEGHVYTAVQVGSQCWMAQNLRAGAYSNGDAILNVQEAGPWMGLNSGAWSHYGNDPAYQENYGKLYNWYAAVDPRNVCPAGWHVPADADWQIMETALGMPADELELDGYRGEAQQVGGSMKSSGTEFWSPPNSGATNGTGFSGLPGGARFYLNGGFSTLGELGFWWSASQAGEFIAWSRYLTSDLDGIGRYGYPKGSGFAVRCVRD